MERGFSEFTSAELDIGYKYAIDVSHEQITRETLRVAGNQAGAIFKAKREKQEKCDPRQAATEALRGYCQRNHLSMSIYRFNAYVRGIAKMLSERNPQTVAKRNRERVLADIQAAS